VDPDCEADPRELAEILQKGDNHFDQRQPFSDLRTALLEKASQWTKREEAVAAGNSKSVEIAFCEEDRADAAEIKQRLQQRYGFRVQFALPPSDSAGSRNQINRALFEEMDHVLVYYSRHEEWMVLTCLTVRKALKKKGKRPSGALVLHPPPPRKDDCDQIDFASLRRASANDFASIDQWANGVRGASA